MFIKIILIKNINYMGENNFKIIACVPLFLCVTIFTTENMSFDNF